VHKAKYTYAAARPRDYGNLHLVGGQLDADVRFQPAAARRACALDWEVVGCCLDDLQYGQRLLDARVVILV